MSRVTTERRWRKKGRRGVSPIIATILLVAITVVLAAVLYILISGLTGSSGSKPYTVGFGQGNPSQTTGATPTYYDELPLSVTTGLTTNLFAVKIITPTGTGVTAATAPAACVAAVPVLFTTCAGASTAGNLNGWYVALASQNGAVLATYGSAGWTYPAGTTSIPLSNADELVVITGNIAGGLAMAGSANTISVYGTAASSVSGSTVL